MTNQPNKATVKEGLPTAYQVLNNHLSKMGLTMAVAHESILLDAMQSYSDQQNAELMEQNRKNQSRWAKDRVAQDKKHDADMMEACGKIVDLEERVKELEGLLTIWVKQNNYLRRHSISDFDEVHDQTKKALKK